MPAKALCKIAIVTALVISASVVTYNVLYAPDKRNGAEKISDAVEELPNGVDKAARQLESRTPADKLHDTHQDATEHLKKAFNQ
jgi:hypothetical protein